MLGSDQVEVLCGHSLQFGYSVLPYGNETAVAQWSLVEVKDDQQQLNYVV